MRKAPEAFRTISEAAEDLQTPAHVLRFWESRFSQVKPVKRAGGRRYYRPGDIDLLAGIRVLLHDQGMTIRGVQKLLQEKGVRHVAEIGTVDLRDLRARSGGSVDDDTVLDAVPDAPEPDDLATGPQADAEANEEVAPSTDADTTLDIAAPDADTDIDAEKPEETANLIDMAATQGSQTDTPEGPESNVTEVDDMDGLFPDAQDDLADDQFARSTDVETAATADPSDESQSVPTAAQTEANAVGAQTDWARVTARMGPRLRSNRPTLDAQQLSKLRPHVARLQALVERMYATTGRPRI